MKIKISQVIKHLNEINYLINWQTEQINADKIKAMPITVTFAINKNKKAISAEYDNYVNDGLSELNKKYNVTINEAGVVDIAGLTDEQKQEYATEIEKLQNVEVEIDIQTVKQEDFTGYQPTLAELDILSFMIEE
jgi:hypothetical protein